MNETTQVIIATLSGFIIAFLAEPVKNYFQNKFRLQYLRVALYKELLSNYSYLETVSNLKIIPVGYLSKDSLRTECYKHALEHEISLFYQLDEATTINTLQEEINRVKDVLDSKNDLLSDEYYKSGDSIFEDFRRVASVFLAVFTKTARMGKFDTKLLKKLSGGYYEQIIGLEHS